jgi:hypothetical protein
MAGLSGSRHSLVGRRTTAVCVMTFEEEIRRLCREAISCTSDEEATAIARRIQALIHERMDEFRGNLKALMLFEKDRGKGKGNKIA